MAKAKHTTVEIYRDRKRQWRFRAKSKNGKVIGIGEGYGRRYDCVRGALRAFPDAQLVEVDGV